MNEKIVELLNKQLSNWNVLNTKLHNYHWYVTGQDFFTLHEKFEEYYTQAATYIDEIAERILMINGKPVARLQDYLSTTTIKEASNEEDPKEMVRSIADDFEQLVKESKELIKLAEDNGDQPTADMFIGIRSNLDQQVWMLRAYLG
ncbi:DNA starvation/stationary phase protection protein [Bacillaceae bacterium S4-13-58]